MNDNYDRFYLKAYKASEPKESFKFIGKIAVSGIISDQKFSVADIGCAKGDFISYLRTLEQFKPADFFGFDMDEVLLKKAREENAFAQFDLCNITDSTSLPQKKFDLVFMNGVTGYFDSLENWTKNLAHLISEKGTGYIYGTFNEEDIDVLIKIRRSGGTDNFFTWGNVFSLSSLKNEFKKLGFELKAYPFEIQMDVARNQEDPIRSWTFKDESGKRLTKNGTQMIQNYFLLEVKR